MTCPKKSYSSLFGDPLWIVLFLLRHPNIQGHLIFWRCVLFCRDKNRTCLTLMRLPYHLIGCHPCGWAVRFWACVSACWGDTHCSWAIASVAVWFHCHCRQVTGQPFLWSCTHLKRMLDCSASSAHEDLVMGNHKFHWGHSANLNFFVWFQKNKQTNKPVNKPWIQLCWF